MSRIGTQLSLAARSILRRLKSSLAYSIIRDQELQSHQNPHSKGSSAAMDPLALKAKVHALILVVQAVLLAVYRIRSQVNVTDNEIECIRLDMEGLNSALQYLHKILPLEDDRDLDVRPLLDGGRRGPASATWVTAVKACEAPLNQASQMLQALTKPNRMPWVNWPYQSSLILKEV